MDEAFVIPLLLCLLLVCAVNIHRNAETRMYSGFNIACLQARLWEGISVSRGFVASLDLDG